MRVADIMSLPVETVAAEDSADTAWEKMRLHRIRHLVVTRGSSVAGVISDRDLGGPHGAPVRGVRSVADLMTGEPVTVSPNTTVREAANLMRGHAIDCLPVLDDRRLRGIVTTQDLLDLIGRGATRPAPNSERVTLKDRGGRPRALTVAKRLHNAKRGATR